MKRFVFLLKAAAVCLAAVLLVAFSENTAKSIEKSIIVCLSEMIPSMFAVMAVSAYIVSEGWYVTIFRPFYFLLHRVIRLDRHTLAVFLLSLAGGYPVGIKLLCDRASQDEGYRGTAQRAAVFCFCVSPPFAINMIGLGVYGSAQAGIIVYASCALSSLLIAAAYSHFFECTGEYSPPQNGGGIISAAESASRSLFTVCTVLIAFNALLEAARSLLSLFSLDIPPFIMGIFEISNLLDIRGASISTLPAVTAITAFGGACVIAQVLAISGGSLSLRRFLPGRAVGAMISAGICRVLIQFTDISVPALKSAPNSYKFSPNTGVWILLVLMAVIFFGKNKKNFKKG